MFVLKPFQGLIWNVLESLPHFFQECSLIRFPLGRDDAVSDGKVEGCILRQGKYASSLCLPLLEYFLRGYPILCRLVESMAPMGAVRAAWYRRGYPFLWSDSCLNERDKSLFKRVLL